VAHNDFNASAAPFYTNVTGDDIYDALQTATAAAGTQQAAYIDPSIDDIFSTSSAKNIHNVAPNSYIGFATYNFLPFPEKASSTDNPNDLKYDYLPVFQGIQSNAAGTLPAIFPISMLYNYQTAAPITSSNSIDTSLFKAQMLPEANALYNYKKYNNSGYGKGSDIFNDDKTTKDNFKKNLGNNMYYFDIDKLFDKETRILNVVDCNQIPKNTNPIDFTKKGFRYRTNTSEYIDISSDDIKEAFYVLWNLYGN
jgi:hypothetical protein